MKEHSCKIYYVLFFWFIINLITAAFTELCADEAYYWVYGFDLDWGYFDHPPLIAVYNSIIDRNIWHSELSVRLLSVISSVGYIWVLYKIIQPKDLLLFCAIIFSSFAVNVFGFVSVPDTPLIFFSGLFYWVYIRYYEKDDWQSILGLSIIIPLLFYTKYHALLVVLFSLLASPSVFKRKSFYLILASSIVLYLPHIYWQIVNDYPSVKYHFFERNASEYQIYFTIDYLIGQFTFYGIFTVLASMAFWFTKKKSFQSKLLMINYIGFFLFFALSSIKGWVEVNWTLPCITAISVLAYSFFIEQGKALRKPFLLIQLVVIFIFGVLRIHLIYPLYDFERYDRTKDFHNNKALALAVLDSVKGTPVYATRYQEASILSYYSNSYIPSINLNGRKNLFNSWHAMKEVVGKPGFILMDYVGNDLFVAKSKKRYTLHFEDKLPAFEGVEIIDCSYQNDSLTVILDTNWVEYMSSFDLPHETSIILGYSIDSQNFENIIFSFSQLEIKNLKNASFNFGLKLRKGVNPIELKLKTHGLGFWSKKYVKEISVE